MAHDRVDSFAVHQSGPVVQFSDCRLLTKDVYLTLWCYMLKERQKVCVIYTQDFSLINTLTGPALSIS